MSFKISVIKIVEDTIVDGPGFRTSVYCAGCSHRCSECHNKVTWDINSGTLTDVQDIYRQLVKSDLNITFTGGDPFYQVKSFTALAKLIKENTDKNIWCYTGYTFEQIIASEKLSALLPYIDVLVDGRFEKALADSDLIFRGSTNQRLIDVKQSIVENSCVLFNYRPFPDF